MSAGTATDTACDVRFGQVGLANIRILADTPEQIRNELARRVEAAPALFARTAAVIDLSHLAQQPADTAVQALLDAVRAAGMLPVGLAYGSAATEALSQRLNLPAIARFRDAYERESTAPPTAAAPAPEPTRDLAPASAAPGTLIHDSPVRSGQQLYAQRRDLAVINTVANGAEVIADGCIHVYGALRGRALAGAQGDTAARIFCTEFRAQLISIAGQYRVFEELPEQFAGKAVQCWLENDKLRIDLLQARSTS